MIAHEPNDDSLEEARRQAAEAAADSGKAARELRETAARIQALARAPQHDEEALRELIARRDAQLKAVATARAAERAARAALRDRLSRWLPRSAKDDASRLAADWPIVFLPVRIETRFDAQPPRPRDPEWRPSLMVRVYPDEIFGDAHETELTQAQFDAGVDFWTTAWDPAKESLAWRGIVALYPPQRAAWIVRRTTPTNLATRGAGAPELTPLPAEAQHWTRPVLCRVLPDRWQVLCYRGGQVVAEATSAPVQEPLALSVDPASDAEDPAEAADVSGHGLVLDHEVKWTVDFQAALEIGMAARVPLTAGDAAAGFDEVLVFGLKASLAPDASATRLAALFEAHHYTRGFAFLRQGTPTNNTSDAPSGFPPDDTGGAHSYGIERGPALNVAGGSGRLFTRALGLPDELTEHVEQANLDEQGNARAMAEALWPCTFGYFLRQMMHPELTRLDVDRAYSWFVDHVRARGPLPAFRIGGTPYGILPVTALSRWKVPDTGDPFEENLGGALRTLVKIWSGATANVPRIGRTTDADRDLLATLGLDASTRGVRVRPALGPTAQYNFLNLLGTPLPEILNLRQAIARQVLRDIGHPEWDPLVTWMTFERDANEFSGHLVAPVLSEEPGSLSPNYIRWIADAEVRFLRLERTPFAKKALLYHFLRHAALTEYSRLADTLLATTPEIARLAKPDEELVKFESVAGPQRPTAFERLDARVAGVTGNLTIAEYLVHPQRSIDKLGGFAYRQTLGRLAALSTAELDRLFGETLDVCSHRLDAWVTSLASKRLAEMRSRTPAGAYLGAYAWVENLRPVTANRVRIERTEEGRDIFAQVDNGGFIAAPTMTHANTAAVLRNAFLTRSGENAERYRVDLSSERVRQATFVLDAVRAGQQLGAVLGYQFERGLHEGHPGVELNRYIDVFRSLYPLVANKAEGSAEPAEAIAARNVVDGVRLREAWRTGRVPFESDARLPATGAHRTAIEAELGALEATADALADLLTAEGVFQVMRGNLAGASASFDSMAGGARPPEPEIARQPRGGTSLTHRFGIVLGSGLAAPAAWTAPASPRSTAAPHLDSWIGRLLGDPAAVRCTVALQPVDPAPKTITLADLQLRPIDFLALAVAPTAGEAVSELDLRIVRAASFANDAAARVDHTPAADRSLRSFPEMIEVAGALRDLIGGARPLGPADLLPPESGAAASAVALDGGGRGTAARLALEKVKNDLQTEVDLIAATAEAAAPDLTALRAQLMLAAQFGVAGAFPATFTTTSPELRAELLDRGRATLRQIAKRFDDAAAKTAQDEIAASVFGSGFIFLYEFTPADGTILGQALGDSAALVGDPFAPAKWLQKAAPVRAPLRRWRRLTLYAQALGEQPFALDVVQLPYAPAAAWVALPFADEAHRPPDGRVSVVLHRAAAPAASSTWAGLIVDEWSEIIPAEKEQTAIAFHYDDPGAEAAQAVLLAVPSAGQQAWSFDTIVDTLRETFALAKIRGADLENLGTLGQLIPAIFLASNPAGDAVSTRLELKRDSVILTTGLSRGEE
jgi:hypothetical protein